MLEAPACLHTQEREREKKTLMNITTGKKSAFYRTWLYGEDTGISQKLFNIIFLHGLMSGQVTATIDGSMIDAYSPHASSVTVHSK